MSTQLQVIESGPFYTYMHRRLDTGAPFYIGKGTGLRAWSKGGRNRHWHNVNSAHGRAVEILAVWASNADAIEHEKLLIECLRSMGLPLCNVTSGGEGSTGRRLSDEAKARISTANRGRQKTADQRAATSAQWLGKPKPHEQRVKLSIAQSGTKRTAEEIAAYLPALRAAMARPDVRERISAAAVGRTPSAETRSKMSASRVGKVASPETRARISAGIKRAAPPSALAVIHQSRRQP